MSELIKKIVTGMQTDMHEWIKSQGPIDTETYDGSVTAYLLYRIARLEHQVQELKEEKENTMPSVNKRLLKLTDKMREAERVVLSFIEDHGRPPTYRELADNLGVGISSAYNRMKYLRHLMKNNEQ